MNQKEKEREERSERIVKLFNAFKGKPISEAPGPIPAFSKWLDGRIIKVQRGEIVLEYKLRAEMANPTGLLHGGMQAALIDDTIGMCTATLGYKGFLITIDAQINFLGKVKIDESVRVKASMVREGRHIVHFFAQVSDLEGKLIATGNANLLKTKYTPDYIKALDNDQEFMENK
ncbi:MAG: PaaI family thioesterase [Promethearchaeota archaeon]|nr:MAG: PaaI family thioesterase [Candidatus Lokiarchaeota archaeon]